MRLWEVATIIVAIIYFIIIIRIIIKMYIEDLQNYRIKQSKLKKYLKEKRKKK